MAEPQIIRQPGHEVGWALFDRASISFLMVGNSTLRNPSIRGRPDTLVFPKSGKATRRLNGNGSMTRDGKTVFMRIGVHAHATADRTHGKVGVYNVATKKASVHPPTSPHRRVLGALSRV